MSNNPWVEESEIIYLSKELYQKLVHLASKKTGGYTGQGIVTDLVEEIVQDYLDSQKVSNPKAKFQVKTHFDILFPYVEITSEDENERDNSFLGIMSVGSKDAVIRVAKKCWGIPEDQLEFVE